MLFFIHCRRVVCAAFFGAVGLFNKLPYTRKRNRVPERGQATFLIYMICVVVRARSGYDYRHDTLSAARVRSSFLPGRAAAWPQAAAAPRRPPTRRRRCRRDGPRTSTHRAATSTSTTRPRERPRGSGRLGAASRACAADEQAVGLGYCEGTRKASSFAEC